jgi:DNA-binding PadR family transcriptional regulator
MIDRLEDGGLIAVGATERDERYPERTTYHLTEEGRAVCRQWLTEMIATPRNEFPEFPAALSFVMLLPPESAGELLEERRERLTQRIAEYDAELAAENDGTPVPRWALLETEYLKAIAEAEVRWIAAILDDLQQGTLTWNPV